MTMTKQEIKSLSLQTASWKRREDLPYTHFQVKADGITITAYTSGKVVFAGEAADYYAQGFGHTHSTTVSTSSNNSSDTDLSSRIKGEAMAGSDEVGTGDYFGPVVVCAALVRKEDYDKIPVSEILDTKQMNDDKIRIIAPVLIKQLIFSHLILDNRKYNEVHRTQNMNVIKTKLHNQAFIHLAKKATLPQYVIIDQFLQKSSYYKHLSKEKEVYKNLIFETKAENKFIAVACGAIIARYYFLDYFDKLEAKYEMEFPKGAGKQVDQPIRDFVNRFGESALYDVAKVHFVNTERIIGHPLD